MRPPSVTPHFVHEEDSSEENWASQRDPGVKEFARDFLQIDRLQQASLTLRGRVACGE